MTLCLAAEDMQLWPMEEGFAPEMKGLSEEELRQGVLLIDNIHFRESVGL